MSTAEQKANEHSMEERLRHAGARIDDLIARVQSDVDLERIRDEFTAFAATVRAELDAWHTRIDQLKAAAEQASIELV